MRFIVPNQLRKKHVSSGISREIFFIDCFNDLDNCANSNFSYDFIRSSVLLRMLLLDQGLETISKKYNYELEFFACESQIEGTQFTGKQIRNLNDIFIEITKQKKETHFLNLCEEPLKKYSLNQFVEKVCLKITGSKDNCFSIKNIIETISNKHGGAHLEPNFDSSTYDTFFLGQFSPYSLKDGNFFLIKIKEILTILVISLIPLCNQVIKNLENCDKENLQKESSSSVYMMTYEEYKKRG